MISESQNIPVIAFLANSNDRSRKKIRELLLNFNPNQKWIELRKGKPTIATRERARTMSSGLFLVDPCFARGLDLKMLLDARVILIDNDSTLSLVVA